MKNIGWIILVAIAAPGCLDWAGAWERAKEKEKQRGTGDTKTAYDLRAKLEDGEPDWTVFRPNTGLEEDGVIAQSGDTTLRFRSGDRQSYEAPIARRAASLLDYYAIARALADDNYRLPLQGGSGKGAKSQAAAKVHDELLRYVLDQTRSCSRACEGDYRACGSGRSFGKGIPCNIGDDGVATLPKKYGRDWCASACNALRDMAEGER